MLSPYSLNGWTLDEGCVTETLAFNIVVLSILLPPSIPPKYTCSRSTRTDYRTLANQQPHSTSSAIRVMHVSHGAAGQRSCMLRFPPYSAHHRLHREQQWLPVRLSDIFQNSSGVWSIGLPRFDRERVSIVGEAHTSPAAEFAINSLLGRDH